MRMKKKISFNKIQKLYKYISPYKINFYLGLFFLVLTSITALIFPKLVGDLIDGAIISEKKINTIAVYLLILFSAQSIFSYFRIFLFVNVAEKALSNLRQETFNHLIKLPLTFFNKRKVGELNSRISADITLLQETFTTTFAEFIRQTIIIFGGIIFLFFISLKLTVFMLAIIPAIMIFAVYFGKKIKDYSKKVQKEIAESNNIVEECLQGIQIVKSFTNEKFESLKYQKKTNNVAKTAIIGGKYRGAFASFIIMCVFGAIISVIWYGTKQVYSGNLEMGELFSFVLYTVFIGGSVGGIADLYSKIIKAVGSSEDLLDILETKKENTLENKVSVIKNGNITFNNVSFFYKNRKENKILNKINFNVDSSKSIAIVGPSGSGKSTIVSLVLRLYDLVDGEILIDDTNINDFNLSFLRSQIGVVPQDTFLFGTTIRENILYGNPDSSEKNIIEAAKKANAHNFIMEFEDQYETLVGDRGVQLSGGQRQRISIARTILKNPKILILDEATSSLDSESENQVQLALNELMKNRTTIIITHRLSTIKKVNKILVLSKGKITEEGTHEELSKLKNGLYQKLSKLQYFN